jgi:hypothetical protein
MPEPGMYPFVVYVRNKFGDSDSGVKIQVKHHYHPNYDESEALITSEDIHIKHGETVCFPLFFLDESLDISLEGSPSDSYYIWAGVKAKCYPSHMDNPTYIPSPIGKQTVEQDEGPDTFYGGGTWELQSSDTSWTLRIKKYSPDPEDDDVIIGTGTPG